MGAPSDGKGVNQLDEWSEKDQQRVTVREGGGFLYNLQLQSKIDSSPDGGLLVVVSYIQLPLP